MDTKMTRLYFLFHSFYAIIEIYIDLYIDYNDIYRQ